jgi:hypothetical protein
MIINQEIPANPKHRHCEYACHCKRRETSAIKIEKNTNNKKGGAVSVK